jgi:hypothetical protein
VLSLGPRVAARDSLEMRAVSSMKHSIIGIKRRKAEQTTIVIASIFFHIYIDVCVPFVLVLHLFLLRVDNIQFSLLRCRLFLFACGLSDSHSFCLSLSFSCNKNTLAVEQASERAAISHPSAINYLCRVLDTLAHKQPFLLLRCYAVQFLII